MTSAFTIPEAEVNMSIDKDMIRVIMEIELRAFVNAQVATMNEVFDNFGDSEGRESHDAEVHAYARGFNDALDRALEILMQR